MDKLRTELSSWKDSMSNTKLVDFCRTYDTEMCVSQEELCDCDLSIEVFLSHLKALDDYM